MSDTPERCRESVPTVLRCEKEDGHDGLHSWNRRRVCRETQKGGAGMVLRVVMLDTWRTEMAITHEGQAMPYGRRLVTIELTPEQRAALAPRRLGVRCGDDVFEERGDAWIELVEPPPTTDPTER